MSLLVVSVSAAILLSAMCSLFEAVLYSVPISHIETMASEGRKTGRILRGLRREVDRPISAILSLNTIANTAGAAVGGAAFAAVYGAERLAWFSAAFTLAILVFSEVVPKTAGVVYAKSLSGLIARPLRLLVAVFMPLVWFLRFVTRLISLGRVSHAVSEEELLVMTKLGLQAGTIEADEAEVIQNILQLETKTARDVMTPRTVMAALHHQLTVDQARVRPGVLEHSRLPVYDKGPDDVIGIAHRRDVLAASAEGRGGTKVAELMRPVRFVSDSTRLDRMLRLFLESRQHLLVVVDEHGGVAGVITLEDVLEEILGKEIVDEFDAVADLQEMARRRRQTILEQSDSEE